MTDLTRLGLSDAGPRVLPDRGPLRRTSGTTNVVFIHGVLSNSGAAWTAENGVTWPHLLQDSSEFADVGIYMFSYAAGPTVGNYQIEDVAASLREFLRDEQLLEARHLVIVAHSMGGIAARRYLVSDRDSLIRKEIAVGLLLVASPSLGSRFASLLKPLNRLLGNSQLTGLEPASSNQWLGALDNDFLALVADAHLTLVGKELLEVEPPPLMEWVSNALIVEAFSGHRYFPEPVTIAGSNHMSVCKPDSADSGQYRAMANVLRSVRAAGPPRAKVSDELERLRTAYQARGREYVASLRDAIGRVGSALSPLQRSDLEAVATRFLAVHAQHLALLATGDLVKADDLRVLQLDPLQDDALALIEEAGQRLSADLHRRVRLRYIAAPEPGADPEYDEARNGSAAIYEAIERLKASRYRLDGEGSITPPVPPRQAL